jgi:hypothetical protein
VPAAEPGTAVAVDGAMGAMGFEWAVPTLVLTVPGLLLIVAVTAQAAIGVAFLPLVRRFLSGDRRRRT